MTVEPNGLEENTCLMIRDFLYTSGTYIEDNWADVSCYQKIDAYIICEKALVFPWEGIAFFLSFTKYYNI